jgi:hypothetical protein
MKPHSIYHLVSALAIGAVAVIATLASPADGAGPAEIAADARQAFTEVVNDAPVTR